MFHAFNFSLTNIFEENFIIFLESFYLIQEIRQKFMKLKYFLHVLKKVELLKK